jgi:hypothetical protein
MVVQTVRLGNAKERVGELEVKLQTQVEQTQKAVDANLTNMSTILMLEGTVSDMIVQRQADADERERELENRDREVDLALQIAEEDRRERLELFHATQSCDELANMRVDLACPAIADRLRERSRTGSSH